MASETDTEVAAHLLELEVPRRRRPDRPRCRRVCRRLRGCLHPGRRRRARTRPAWSPPGATRRWWSASARARTSSAPTSPPSSSTPARRSSSARTRSSRSPATASTVTGFDGTPAGGPPLPRRLGPLGRREGRPRLVHAQGDLRAAARGRRLAAGAAYGVGSVCSSTRCGSPTRTCATSTRSSSSPAGRRSTPAWSRSTPSSTGPGSRSRSSSPRSSATATRSSPTPRWSSRSASPARPPTRCRRSGTRAPSGRRCWRSATPTARRSRASPTR